MIRIHTKAAATIGIAAINLDGKGIRELTSREGFVWGIAGMVLDNDEVLSRL